MKKSVLFIAGSALASALVLYVALMATGVPERIGLPIAVTTGGLVVALGRVMTWLLRELRDEPAPKYDGAPSRSGHCGTWR